ncbi:G protein-activated inward rectifier potassium channel 2-like [Aethina tumida]|uniref:G protein-activated inward rectifier potassium channel 2-like n=1 Tax=Aethina tumida TaxID=116153 RepID=UPI00096B1B7E|nr:G protein-activated inward rectifier potassium channel 2-like [Aethina tumida]
MLRYDSALDEYSEIDFNDFESARSLRKLNNRSSSEETLVEINDTARVIKHYGRINIFLKFRTHKPLHEYARDIGYTLLTTRWRWILLTVGIVNLVTYIFFSFLWMWLAHVSGDFEPDNKEPCVVNTKTFTGYLLLSIESITSIGYGYRYPTESCKEVWLIHVFQALCNIALQGILVSAVYVKITMPVKKVLHCIFSKSAVVCLRDGKLCFIFRINDFTSKIWCGTTIYLYFIDKDENKSFALKQMKVQPYGLLIFPLEIVHTIDEDSPLWEFSPEDLATKQYEIVAVAEGSSMITGQVSQNRTSYIRTDIFWGYRFCPCVSFNEHSNKWIVDYKSFKTIIPFDTPLCSAKQLKQFESQTANITYTE